ncbi:hypothetical protein XENORESO_005867, partial [Xenotaenia resolanae]
MLERDVKKIPMCLFIQSMQITLFNYIFTQDYGTVRISYQAMLTADPFLFLLVGRMLAISPLAHTAALENVDMEPSKQRQQSLKGTHQHHIAPCQWMRIRYFTLLSG